MTSSATASRRGRVARQTGRVGSARMLVSEFLREAKRHGLSGETVVGGVTRVDGVTVHKLPTPFTLAQWCGPVTYCAVRTDTTEPTTRMLVTYFTRKPTLAELV